MLLKICWIVWFLGVVSFLVAAVGRVVATAKEQLQAESVPTERMTASDMRVLLMGDRRDPIERHADAMTALWRFACLAVVGMVLAFFATVA